MVGVQHNYHGGLRRGLLPCWGRGGSLVSREHADEVVRAAGGDFRHRLLGPPNPGTSCGPKRRAALWGSASATADRGKTVRRPAPAQPVDPAGRVCLPHREGRVQARQGPTRGRSLLLPGRGQQRPGQGRVVRRRFPGRGGWGLVPRCGPRANAQARTARMRQAATATAATPASQRPPNHRSRRSQNDGSPRATQ